MKFVYLKNISITILIVAIIENPMVAFSATKNSDKEVKTINFISNESLDLANPKLYLNHNLKILATYISSRHINSKLISPVNFESFTNTFSNIKYNNFEDKLSNRNNKKRYKYRDNIENKSENIVNEVIETKNNPVYEGNNNEKNNNYLENSVKTEEDLENQFPLINKEEENLSLEGNKDKEVEADKENNDNGDFNENEYHKSESHLEDSIADNEIKDNEAIDSEDFIGNITDSKDETNIEEDNIQGNINGELDITSNIHKMTLNEKIKINLYGDLSKLNTELKVIIKLKDINEIYSKNKVNTIEIKKSGKFILDGIQGELLIETDDNTFKKEGIEYYLDKIQVFNKFNQIVNVKVINSSNVINIR